MLALAVALGVSLWDVAGGISGFFVGLLDTHKYDSFGVALAWRVGGRIVTVDRLVRGLIELAVVGGFALLVLRRKRTPTP
jgi:hypothetical protein